MRWTGSMLLGIVLWYVLTLILGFVMGIKSLDHAMKYLIYYNLMLYPVGVWLAFKITKTLFWGSKLPKK